MYALSLGWYSLPTSQLHNVLRWSPNSLSRFISASWFKSNSLLLSFLQLPPSLQLLLYLLLVLVKPLKRKFLYVMFCDHWPLNVSWCSVNAGSGLAHSRAKSNTDNAPTRAVQVKNKSPKVGNKVDSPKRPAQDAWLQKKKENDAQRAVRTEQRKAELSEEKAQREKRTEQRKADLSKKHSAEKAQREEKKKETLAKFSERNQQIEAKIAKRKADFAEKRKAEMAQREENRKQREAGRKSTLSRKVMTGSPKVNAVNDNTSSGSRAVKTGSKWKTGRRNL